MASKELQLVSRIVATGELSKVIDWGITPSDFVTSEGLAMYNHIMGYYSQAESSGSVIGPQLMSQIYPHFLRCDDPGMTVEALCTEVRRERLAIACLNGLEKVREHCMYDPLEAINKMMALGSDLSNIGFGKNTDVFLGDAGINLRRKYHLRQQGFDDSCGLWPWEIMNQPGGHGGFKDDDYIVFYGRPKSKKSWVLTSLIAWLFECEKKILVYTKEMSPENVFDRVIACMAKISYSDLRAGTLNPVDEENFNFTLDLVHNAGIGRNIVCLSGQDVPPGGDTVQWLTSKVDKYNPDFICVDGLYLMSDIQGAKKDNERVRNISRALRQMVLSKRKPLIATLQANRGAAKHEEANLDELAFSDAIGQDATCIMRVINEKDKNTCQLVMGGAREYQLNGFRIHAEPAYNFSYYGPLTASEIIEAEKNDGAPEDDAAAHVANGNGKSKKKGKRGATDPTIEPAMRKAKETATVRMAQHLPAS